ncbi:DUF2807 domain-containing protein [Croceibacterium sp. LX-88]|uniref:DUF2807 domain-containing protein n=1 Tax=Croceibacterium selenioxidans TaxID=2838833 RepID=A0ABS5W836_9SPHN|nr:head GIN domain-containing protein [Croceibacterium selenioxidans]MBT2135252.1 DUF2807 domain-containing protein [Croceibacterium selenioxidans]
MRTLVAAMSLGAALAFGTTLGMAQEGAAVEAPAGTRSYSVGAFDEVTTVGPHRVIVTVGGGHSVYADGPAEALDRFEVLVEGDKLKIQPKEEYRQDHDWTWMAPATFYVTLPRIEAASLAGSGNMYLDRVQGDSFAGSVAGSGEIDIASMQVGEANFSVAGSGDLTARGSAGRSRVSVAGSGAVHAREMRSTTAAVSIVGSGDADLMVDNNANVSIVGSGDVDIAGTATCTVSRMGSGKVACQRG